MPKMPFTGDAVAFARSAPGFSFGIHLVLSRDDLESPVSDPALLPTLTNGHGEFCDGSEIRTRVLLGRLSVDEIAREMEAQIAWLCDRGLVPSHVDSHGHLHKFGVFRSALKRVLPKFGIRRVRSVQDIYMRKCLMRPTFWLGRWWCRNIEREFTTTRHFFMPAGASGGQDWAERLVASLQPGEDTIEVGLHPGRDEQWRRQEFQAAAVLAARARAAGHRVITWNDL